MVIGCEVSRGVAKYNPDAPDIYLPQNPAGWSYSSANCCISLYGFVIYKVAH